MAYISRISITIFFIKAALDTATNIADSAVKAVTDPFKGGEAAAVGVDKGWS